MDENQITIIQDTAKELLAKLDVPGEVTVSEQDGVAAILLDTPDTGMVIGYHGETLDGLQFLLSLILAKKRGQFMRVNLEVGDYRKNRSEYLERLAMQVKERVLEEGNEQTLSDLKPWERRVIHLILQNDSEVTSESVGEGRNRVLVVKPRA